MESEQAIVNAIIDLESKYLPLFKKRMDDREYIITVRNYLTNKHLLLRKVLDDV